MYERFTDRARKVLQLAAQEAQRFNHEYIGTEHILLGLIREGDGVAANVLKNLGIHPLKIRREVERIVQSGPDMVTMGKLPQTPRAKKVIEYSIDEARNLNHNYVGTEHLLLGLLREEEGLASQVLMNLGLKLEDVREEVLNLLGHCLDLPESGAAVQDLPALDLSAQIKQLTQEKEAAITKDDFEKAASLRDQIDKLMKKRERVIRAAEKQVERVNEYDLYVPVRYTDGSPVEPEKLGLLRRRLIEHFGGLVEIHHRIEGSCLIGHVAFRDELVVYRVLSARKDQAWCFLLQLKEELKADLKQEQILIVARNAEVL